MKITTKKLEETKLQLDVEVPPEKVKQKFDEVYAQIGKEANVPGFRPGKAPRDVLEKHHRQLAEEEVIKRLIPDAYRDSLEKEKISAVELPEISDVKLQADTLYFKAVVEILPKIEVKDYKNIKVKYKKITVGQDEVDKTVSQLKELHKADNVDERFARSLGYPTVEDMRAAIEQQLFIQKDNDLRYHLQEELIREIMDKVNFRIPSSLINRRLEELCLKAKQQMALNGATKDQIQSKEEELKKALLKDAETQVKSFLVLQEIAKRENIPPDDNMSQKVIEFLLREARWVTADTTD